MFAKVLTFPVGRKQKLILSSVLTVLVFTWLVYYIVDNWALLSQLSRFTALNIVIISSFCLFQMLVTSLLIYLAMGSLGAKPTLGNMFTVNAATMLLNYTPMRLGTVFRAAYLKQKYRFGYSEFAALFLHTNLLILLIATIIGLVALLIQFGVSNSREQILAVLLSASAIGALLLLFAPLRKPQGESKLATILRTVLRSRELMANDRRIVSVCSALLFIGFVTAAWRLQIVYASLSQDVHPLGVLILAALGYLSMFVNITPGGLGVREAVLAGGAYALNIDFEIGMLAAIIDRGFWLLTTLTAGGVSLLILLPDLRVHARK